MGLLNSCASSTKISGGSCFKSTLAPHGQLKQRLEVRKISFGNEKSKLKDILLANDLGCEGTRIGGVQIKYSAFDALFNVIPFVNSKTLVFEILN